LITEAKSEGRLDPFFVGVVANRLAATLNEQQAALVNTAFSTIVRESLDLACGVFDTRGQMIAQSLSGTPGHINAMATGVRHFVERYPPVQLEEGDVLITNDPWQTAGQINDITICSPVFRDGRLIAFFASTCHAADIGGRMLSGEAQEIFEEGLQIPIMKFARAGEVNEDLVGMIRANVRTPDETIGDVFAQASANEVGARSLLALMDEFDLDSIEPIGDEVIGRSEAAMRSALADLPDGTYRAVGGSDGFDEPVRLEVAVTIAGEEIHLDFAGSSPQSRHGINLVFNYTHAYSSFAMKAAIAPEVPHNAGSFRPVHVSARAGSILNCTRPAPVASRHLIGHMLPSLIFTALAPAMPDRLIAASADCVWMTVWRGNDADDRTFSQTVFQAGGSGARASKDGLNATGFPSGVGAVPTEVIETLTPLVHRRRELRGDSGGAGSWRGGLGQISEMSSRTGKPWSVSALVDRTTIPAPGSNGGLSGAAGSLSTAAGAELPPKRALRLDPDDRIVVSIPGGGGWGDPRLRDPELVRRDVFEGYVSAEEAREAYGVAITFSGDPERLVRMPGDYQVDETKTRRLRGGDGS
jgi:N-methylhydantoinase B